MAVRNVAGRIAYTSVLAFALCNCSFNPPYNDFRKEAPNLRRPILGTGLGAVAGTLLGSTVIGAAVGGTAGTVLSIYRESKRSVIDDLRKQNIQFIEYGDTMTLIVPTDKYYVFDTPHLNDICYAGLNNIIKLLRFYPHSKIYVAGFNDNVGSKHHKKMLSQARAETMIGFLWANNISAKCLKAEGFGDKNTIGDNHWIRGSAYNRRVEIQWFNVPENSQRAPIQGMK